MPELATMDHTLQRITPMALSAELWAPEGARGAIIVARRASGSLSNPAIRQIAVGLQDRGFVTLLAELLGPDEAERRYHSFDIDLLASRVAAATDWLCEQPRFNALPLGYFGASAGAAAILAATAYQECPARALVMWKARSDLAHTALPLVRAPTLFVVGEDEFGLHLNRFALARLGGPGQLAVLPEAEDGLSAADRAARLIRVAGDWFEAHLTGQRVD